MRSVGMNLDPGQADQIIDCMAERADGRWLASEIVDIEPRQNGKGVVLEARAIGGVMLAGEPLVVWTAHEFKTALKAFERVRAYFDNFDHMRKRVKTIRSSTHSTEIILKGGNGIPVGATIAWLARSGGSGRGFASVSPLILDEAYALTEEQVAAIVYATRAARNPQVIYASSAPLKTSAVLRDVCARGRKSARAPKPARGLIYYEWCATGEYNKLLKLVEDNKALDDDAADAPSGRELRAQLFAKVAESNRAYGTRVVDESVIRELRLAGAEQFLREGLGVYPELETGAAIEAGHWLELQDVTSRRLGDVALGVDISPERDWAAISLFGAREDEIGHGQLIHYGPVDGLVAKLAEYNDALRPIAIGMGRGTYASLRDDLRARGMQTTEERARDADWPDEREPARGDVFVCGATEMSAACAQIIDASRHATMRIVPAQQLDDAVRVAQTRRSGDTVAWARTDRAVDISALVSLTVARRSYFARASVMEQEEDYDVASSFG